MRRLARLLPFIATIALLAACSGDGGSTSPGSTEPTPAASPEATASPNNPDDFKDAIAEAIRGYHLILDKHVDKPSGPLLIRGGLEAAREVTAGKPALPSKAPESDEEIAAALAALIGAGGSPNSIIFEFLDGMADALVDRHTTYLEPEIWQDFSANKIAYTGYRSISTPRGSLVWIVDAGSPAATAGLKPGDTILTVNGVSLSEGSTGRTPPQIIGRAVTLTVSRPNSADFSMKLTPQPQVSAIQARMLEGGIAYVRITGFVPPGSSQDFIDTLDREMSQLEGRNPIGWVIDLRSNGGGLVRLAAQTAARFGFSGVFGEAITREGKAEMIRSGEATKREPIVVLINRRTGSSAEMLTTTLKDAGLAEVVGETSAGSVRLANYFEVSGGALQITTADVKTGPSRRALEGSGVTPNVAVELDAFELAAGVDAQLERAVVLLAGE